MPPKPASVDGITRQAVPMPPHSMALNEEIKKEQAAKNNQPSVKNQVRSSKTSSGPIIVIILTVIFMVLLIALAYYAYNKGK